WGGAAATAITAKPLNAIAYYQPEQIPRLTGPCSTSLAVAPGVEGEKVPLADPAPAGRFRWGIALFDDLVGAGEQRLRHGEPERLGCLEVDRQLKLGGRLGRKVGRAGTLQNAIHIGSRTPNDISDVGAVRHQRTVADVFAIRIARGHPGALPRPPDCLTS